MSGPRGRHVSALTSAKTAADTSSLRSAYDTDRHGRGHQRSTRTSCENAQTSALWPRPGSEATLLTGHGPSTNLRGKTPWGGLCDGSGAFHSRLTLTVKGHPHRTIDMRTSGVTVQSP